MGSMQRELWCACFRGPVIVTCWICVDLGEYTTQKKSQVATCFLALELGSFRSCFPVTHILPWLASAAYIPPKPPGPV